MFRKSVTDNRQNVNWPNHNGNDIYLSAIHLQWIACYASITTNIFFDFDHLLMHWTFNIEEHWRTLYNCTIHTYMFHSIFRDVFDCINSCSNMCTCSKSCLPSLHFPNPQSVHRISIKKRRWTIKSDRNWNRTKIRIRISCE